MALTLTASDAGLEIVDRARKQKGYNKTNAVNWLEAANVSRSSLDKFWAQQPIKHENFVAICTAVGVDWQTVVDESDRDIDNSQQPAANKLADFNGLKIAKQIHDWLTALRYEFEEYQDLQPEYCEFIIRIPVRRGRFDRILIRGIPSEAKIRDLQNLQASVDKYQTDEGWLIVNRRISPAVQTELAKDENQHLSCMTFDELIDQDADFEPYLKWLEEEVIKRGIDRKYVSLACDKEEIDPITQHSIATSSYGEPEGWIEGYIKQWLSDDSKEHVSILGEFGTGKTWFSFHYAWDCLRAYKEAKEQGLERPRLPLVIALRDYNKALKVESVLSDLFFNKHDIRLNSSVFDCLNQMGKLVIIFDGFDEMADKVDRQKMIDNFWELARVICPGSKVILTSRTEHFPDYKASKAMMDAELKSSSTNLKWESPRFEILELAKFNEAQIRQVLINEVIDKGLSTDIVEKVMVRAELLDLARRPVMTELIIEAMPEIEAGKPVDMSRVYYYAIVRKMDRDIKAERTFTSLADKLYFLCEIAWEMLSTERMKLNYREFPDRIRQIFPQLVTEAKDLDHWHYDMMGQTILIRNADGDYTPAHRSLLEFLVAYKFAAEAGVLKADFVEAMQEQSEDCIDPDAMPQNYTWTGYLQACVAAKYERRKISPLRGFIPESSEYLRKTFGKEPLTKAVIDLIVLMLEPTNFQPLLDLIHSTKGKIKHETGWIGGNAATLLIKQNTEALKDQDLSYAQMANSDLVGANLQGVNFAKTNLTKSIFESILPSTVLAIATSQDGNFFATGHQDNNIRIWDVITKQLIHTFSGHTDSVDTVTISSDCQWLLSGSRDITIKRWYIKTGQCVQTYDGHASWINTVVFSPDGKWFVSESYDRTIKRWNTMKEKCLHTYTEHLNLANALAIAPNSKWFLSGSRDKTIKRWDAETDICLQSYIGHQNSVDAVAISSDGKWFVSGGSDNTIKRWDTEIGQCIQSFDGQQNLIVTIVISPDDRWFVTGSRDAIIKRWDTETGQCTHTYIGHTDVVNEVAISSDGKSLISGSLDNTLKHWNIETGQCTHTYIGYQKSEFISVTISDDGKYLHSKSNQNIVKRCDINTGRCISFDVEDESFFKKVSTLADNEWVVTTKPWYSSDYETIERKDVKNTQQNNDSSSKENEKKYQSAVDGVVISPDGDWLLSYRNNIIKRWDKPTGKCLQTYIRNEDKVNGMDISPDSDWFVSYSNNIIKRWDKYQDECLETYIGHEDKVNGVAISSDGLYIISYESDSIRSWNVKTGECTYTISNQPYGGMLIGGAIGLTSGQIESLKALGAVDD
jgi:WD40 repeat protein